MITLLPVLLLLLASAMAQADMYCGKASCYDVLGVEPDSTKGEIRKKYHKLSLKMHPDKNRAENAAEMFREISTAYEVLSNEESRSDYDYYLLHPEERMMNQYRYYKHAYAPKTDWRIVLGSALTIFSILHFIIKTLLHKHALAAVRDAPKLRATARQIVSERHSKELEKQFSGKKKLRKMYKETLQQLEEEVITELIESGQVQIRGGNKKPGWRDILAVRLVMFPFHVAKWFYQRMRWFWLFFVLNKEYGETERLYLTRQCLGITAEKWICLDLETRKDLLERELWVQANMAAFQEEQKEEWKDKRSARYKQAIRWHRKNR